MHIWIYFNIWHSTSYLQTTQIWHGTWGTVFNQSVSDNLVPYGPKNMDALRGQITFKQSILRCIKHDKKRQHVWWNANEEACWHFSIDWIGGFLTQTSVSGPAIACKCIVSKKICSSQGVKVIFWQFIRLWSGEIQLWFFLFVWNKSQCVVYF